MQRLWHDIEDHPRSAALFLVYWLAVWAMHWYLWWRGGIPRTGMILHFSAPMIAGGLVGWWRRNAQGGGGPLAAALITVVGVTVVFIKSLADAGAGEGGYLEWSVGWLAASVVFGGFGTALGLLGAHAGAMLARVVHTGARR
jgi:hypothetical protein